MDINKISFSQLGQDKWVLEKYPIDNGYFVDVGFNDGIVLSNTYLLELNGWSGIGIDPLAKNYEVRNNTKIYKDVVYKESDIDIDFAIIKDKDVLSGFTKKISDTMKQYSHEIMTLKTKLLSDILHDANSPNFIHYLSLDTEGCEYEVLETINYDKYKFGCISVEHNHKINDRDNIERLLLSKSYRLYKHIRWESWYILDE